MNKFISKPSEALYLMASIILIVITTGLTGCTSSHSAPVTDGRQSSANLHQVNKGETLYAIAWRYGKDYRTIARINHIVPPYKVYIGQHILLTTAAYPATTVKHSTTKSNTLAARQQALIKSPLLNSPQKGQTATRVANKSFINPKSIAEPIFKPIDSKATPGTGIAGHFNGQWGWPIRGRIISGFGNNKGIDISARPGTPVQASAAGKVVYAGSGLRGYGELIIIKHNTEYLSAYAHNRKLYVHEGSNVKAGETIAEVGDSDAKQPMLHFEIRRAGKPVDPMQYLAKD